MKVLLLGANGQLGSDIKAANSRRQRPFEIDCILRQTLDVTDAARISEVLDRKTFDALINCTSYHKTDEVENEGSRAVAVNAEAPRLLARLCSVKRARFIHISTDYVFGGNRSVGPLRETDAPAPVNVYGTTKLLGEALAQAENPDTLVLRVASLFGIAGASGKGGNFVETMIKFGRERGELKVVADQVMSPTATADIAGWILRLLECRAPAGLYHAVNTGATTWYDFACAIIERSNVKAEVRPIATAEFPTAAMRPAFSALNNGKLAAFVGPIRGWQEALQDYLVAKGHAS